MCAAAALNHIANDIELSGFVAKVKNKRWKMPWKLECFHFSIINRHPIGIKANATNV